LIWLIALLLFFYFLLLVWVWKGWSWTIHRSVADIDTNFPFVSILIPVRNEEDSIAACIDSIAVNDYPSDRYEIILVDDHSGDNTVACALSVGTQNLKIVQMPDGKSGKKAALTEGLSAASYGLIICTDGDCIVQKKWIRSHVARYKLNDLRLCTGTVLPRLNQTILGDFQWMDFAMTMAVTANGIKRQAYFLANGANMSYPATLAKVLNDEVKGTDLASGDDVFMVQAHAQKDPHSICFINDRESWVETKSEKSLADFLSQRRRWATKSMYTSDYKVIAIQAFVFMVNVVLAGLLVAAIIHPAAYLWPAVLAILFKATVDFLMLASLAVYYDRPQVLRSFVPAFFMYMVYIIYAGVMAMFPAKYHWKGRKVK